LTTAVGSYGSKTGDERALEKLKTVESVIEQSRVGESVLSDSISAYEYRKAFQYALSREYISVPNQAINTDLKKDKKAPVSQEDNEAKKILRRSAYSAD